MKLATCIEIFYLPIMAFTVYHLLLCDFFVDFFKLILPVARKAGGGGFETGGTEIYQI